MQKAVGELHELLEQKRRGDVDQDVLHELVEELEKRFKHGAIGLHGCVDFFLRVFRTSFDGCSASAGALGRFSKFENCRVEVAEVDELRMFPREDLA